MAADRSHLVNGERDFPDDGEGAKAENVKVDYSSRELESFCMKTGNGVDWNLVTDLDLAFNNLSSLPADLASRLPSIRTLDISGNIFETLPVVLGELPGIVSLKANESCIRNIGADSLSQLDQLEHLSLVGNTLSEIDDDFIFPGNLQRLCLDESELTSLPRSICDLQSLRVLEAADNGLTELPEHFGDMCNLEIINLSNNQLVYFPDSFEALGRVKTIDVSHNSLKRLPDFFASMDTLVTLYANHNQLDVLPSWISQLTNIETLALKDNFILKKPLDEEFCENVRDTLKTFLIGGNFIESLPKNMGLLHRVEFFHIGSIIGELERSNFQNGNWIRDLPADFGGMVSLTKLRLDENQIDVLPESFGDLVNLEFLDLGQNLLRHLPETFCNLRSLRKCLLSKNCLQGLPEGFGNLHELRELFLNANELTVLPASMVRLSNLRLLDLFDNKLSTIPEFLSSLTQLTGLDLDCNNFGDDDLEVPRMFPANHYSTDRKMFGAGSAETTEGTSLTPLVVALQKKRSLWASHGETKDRQRDRRNTDIADGASQESSLDGRDSEVLRLNGSLGDEDWDEELQESPYDEANIYEHPTRNPSPRGQPAVDFYFLPSEEHAPETGPAVFGGDVEEGQFDDAD